MKTVAGLLQAQDGTIMLDGQDITHMRPHRIVQAGICYVPRRKCFRHSRRGKGDMGAFIRGGDAQRPKCMHSFPMQKTPAPRRLSQRRPATDGRHGQALMLDPRLLLLDEPTAGLSPMLVGVMLEKIVEINSTGVAILIVEQNARRRCSAPTVGMSWPWDKIATRTLVRRCSRTRKFAPCSWVGGEGPVCSNSLSTASSPAAFWPLGRLV